LDPNGLRQLLGGDLMADLKTLEENTAKLLSVSGKIRKFLAEFLDKDSFVETDVFLSGENQFYKDVPYGEGVITGYGEIAGNPVYVAVQNPEVLKGSVGKAHAEKILKCIERADKNGAPMITVIDSAGVRIGEGLPALDAFGKMIAAINEQRRHNYHISLINGTSAGLMSVYAGLSDFILAAEGSSASLNPPLRGGSGRGARQKARGNTGGERPRLGRQGAIHLQNA
jgi:Acetyl-CoA carboxylase, carboxyltransferase component (subunits alpha and beta)